MHIHISCMHMYDNLCCCFAEGSPTSPPLVATQNEERRSGSAGGRQPSWGILIEGTLVLLVLLFIR